MGKKRRRVPPTDGNVGHNIHEEKDDIVIEESDMLHDELDEELLDRDEIRYYKICCTSLTIDIQTFEKYNTLCEVNAVRFIIEVRFFSV